LDIKDVSIELLSDKHDFTNFSCLDPDFNEFIREDAYELHQKKLAQTYVLVKSGKCIGYCSISMDGIHKNRIEKHADYKYDHIPAFKIARLAVDTSHKGNEYGKLLVLYCISLVKKFTQYIGCRLVVVDSKIDYVNYYKKEMHFKEAKTKKRNYKTLYLDMLRSEKTPK